MGMVLVLAYSSLIGKIRVSAVPSAHGRDGDTGGWPRENVFGEQLAASFHAHAIIKPR